MTTRPTSRSDRPRYPELAEDIGEDPARYLHEPDETTYARIRGIVREEVLDAWYQVEEDLGPRRDIIRALNHRRAVLEEDGDRDD